MKVFRGRLVHSLKPEKIEILEDAVIGYSERDGKVYILHYILLIGAMTCRSTLLKNMQVILNN